MKKHEVGSMKYEVREKTGNYTVFLKVTAVLIICFAVNGFASALTLKECIDLALENNPSIKAARETLNAASAKMGQAASAALPSVSLTAMKGKNYTQPMVMMLPPSMGGGSFATSPDEPSDYTTYSLTAQQAIFTGGKIVNGMAMAKSGYEIAFQDLRKASIEVEYEVTKAYFEYLKSKKSAEIVESSAKDLNRNLSIAQVLYNSGIASNAELLRIKTAIAGREVMRIQANSGMDIARLALEAAMGKRLDPSATFEDEVLPEDAADIPSKDSLLKKAFENRPDYISFRESLNIAGSALNIAYSGHLPNIAFAYSAGKTKNEYNTNSARSSDMDNWRAMFTGSWAVFDGFSTENKIREAAASLNALKARENSLKDGITLDVSSAHLGVTAAMQRTEAAELAQDLASRTLRSVEVSYAANITSRQMYIETQTAYLAARTEYWGAKYDLEIAKARLNKAVGGKII